MHNMIVGQPDSVAETLRRLAEVDVRAFLGRTKRVLVTGCGTSFHAAMYGARVLQAAARDRISVHAVQAYDLLHDAPPTRGTTVLGVSHSGATETTNRALRRARRAGARVLAMSGLDGTPMGRLAERCIVLGSVHDRSWANTMSYTTQLAAFAYLAGSIRPGGSVPLPALRAIPRILRSVLGCEGSCRRAGRELAGRDRVTFLGNGLDDVTALEAALKIRETCSLPASGYQVEQFLHGPFLSLDRRDAIVALLSRDDGLRASWVLDGFASAGASVVTIGDARTADIRLPSVPALLRPIVNAVPMQFLAYYAALARKSDPDVMRSRVPRYQPGLELLFTWRPRRVASARSSRLRRRSGGGAAGSSARSRT